MSLPLLQAFSGLFLVAAASKGHHIHADVNVHRKRDHSQREKNQRRDKHHETEDVESDEGHKLSSAETPKFFSRAEDNALRRFMKNNVRTQARKDSVALLEANASSQVKFDTEATERYGICEPTMHLTSCLTRGTAKTVSCMTQAPTTGGCAIEFLRVKDETSAKYNELYYELEATRTIPTGIAVQDFTEPLIVHALPTVSHLDFNNLQSLTFENLNIPEGVRTLRLANVNLRGYPIPGFRNITLPTSMRRIAIRHNMLATFDPSEWANIPLEDIIIENNGMRDLGNVTYPPSVTRLNVRNNQLEAITGTVLPPNLVVLRAGNNRLSNVEALPIKGLNRLRILDLRENRGITALTKAISDNLPPAIVELDFSYCKINRIDRDFVVPESVRVLKLRNNKITSIANLTLPPRLENFTLAGNKLTDSRITRANFDIINRCTRITSPAFNMSCRPDEELMTTKFDLAFCVVVDASVSVTSGSAAMESTSGGPSFTSTVLPILLAAVGGTMILAALYLFVQRRVYFRARKSLSATALHELDHDVYGIEATDVHSPPMMSSSVNVSSLESSATGTVIRSASAAAGSVTLSYPMLYDTERCPASLQVNDWAKWAISGSYIREVVPLSGNVELALCESRRVVLKPLNADDVTAMLQMLTTLHHPTIVEFCGVTWNAETEALTAVVEYMAGGTLRMGLIQSHTVNDSQKLQVASSVAQALTYLHENGIAHGRVNLDTVLLDGGHDDAKLNLISIRRDTSGNDVYTAPEMRNSTALSFEADVYAFGVLLAALGREQEPDDDDPEWFDGPCCPPVVLELGRRCVEVDPRRRPLMNEIAALLKSVVHGFQLEGAQSDCVSAVSTTETFNHGSAKTPPPPTP
ncbi:hypothetical protein AeMF1_013450 [Aphanomyces euteiches]|nr:hypothetical protein AeMF1_013450 [Aphanomyces euteiches]KAH9183912.1 hypothetical protein AeNC1_014113 [Aphanomyces euteiches]